MRYPIRAAAAFLGLMLALAAGGCTTRHKISKEAVPCTSECTNAKALCLAGCARTTGQAQVVEDVREHLCDKRCVEDYEGCMLKCPGVGG